MRHPELGTRWLLTRVEPGALAGGRTTTSVVTLDVTDQERAQRRNEQLLRELTTILDSSTAGIAYLRGPMLVRCNRRFERMLGFAPGGRGRRLAGGDLRPQPRAARRRAARRSRRWRRGRPFDAELPLARRAARATLWYSLSVRRAQSEGGPSEAVAVLTDITRLKSQQAELEKLLRDRELMFSLSDVGIVYQRGSRIERANQAMAALTGYSAPELNTLDAAELYEDARACVEFEAQVAQALREHGRFSGERRLRRRDGSLTWVQVAVRPVDGDDDEAGLICSFVDVDERHRARESLAVQAERTRAILELGAGGHRHRVRAWHRVDEPLGAAHVRRRTGRLRRRADQHRGHRRARPPAAPRRLAAAPGRKGRPRPSNAGSRRATGASSGSSATPC